MATILSLKFVLSHLEETSLAFLNLLDFRHRRNNLYRLQCRLSQRHIRRFHFVSRNCNKILLQPVIDTLVGFPGNSHSTYTILMTGWINWRLSQSDWLNKFVILVLNCQSGHTKWFPRNLRNGTKKSKYLLSTTYKVKPSPMVFNLCVIVLNL